MAQPTGKWNDGGICITEWPREYERDGEMLTFKTYQVERRYKVGEEWKSGTSFSSRELIKLRNLITAIEAEKNGEAVEGV